LSYAGKRARSVETLATSGPAAAQKSHEPDDYEYHDHDPQKVHQGRRRVKQEPQDKEDDRCNDEQVDHLGLTHPRLDATSRVCGRSAVAVWDGLGDFDDFGNRSASGRECRAAAI
jgi:hypothetical protein